MPRRCLCDRLRERIATDPRLATLPMGAKWMWLALAERAAASTPDGVLRLGCAFGFLTGIAMLIQAAEPEVQTHWETLAARGLVIRQGDDVLVPELEALVTRRAAVARANGASGGRPRRGETPEQARARRAQGALLLPVPGAAAAPAEEPSETEPETRRDSAPPLPTTSTESLVVVGSGGDVAREATPSAIGCEVARIAGLDPVRQRFDYRPVIEWLAEGADRALILDVVRDVAGKPGFEPHRVRTLRYFTPAMQERLAERAAAKPQPDRPLRADVQAIIAWANGGMDWNARPGVAA